MLSDDEKRRIDLEAGKYPERRAALSEALLIVQETRGWIDDESLADVAAAVGISPAAAESVATFYELVYRRPVGSHVIQVCDSVSCFIRDGDSIIDHLKKRLAIDFGGTTADGKVTLLPAGCLGVCEMAPAMLVDGKVHGNLTREKVDDIVDAITGGRHGDAAL